MTSARGQLSMKRSWRRRRSREKRTMSTQLDTCVARRPHSSSNAQPRTQHHDGDASAGKHARPRRDSSRLDFQNCGAWGTRRRCPCSAGILTTRHHAKTTAEVRETATAGRRAPNRTWQTCTTRATRNLAGCTLGESLRTARDARGAQQFREVTS